MSVVDDVFRAREAEDTAPSLAGNFAQEMARDYAKAQSKSGNAPAVSPTSNKILIDQNHALIMQLGKLVNAQARALKGRQSAWQGAKRRSKNSRASSKDANCTQKQVT